MNFEESGAVRDTLVSYMKENPLLVRNSGDSRLQYRASNVNNRLITKTRMTIAIIIALLLGGGTSFAAEGALPGDVLYPIKIHINENIQELVAVSDEAEAKVQMKLAGHRLEEAEKLAFEGNLTVETSADLKARFEEHSEKSKEHRLKVGDVDTAANISSDTEAFLGVHGRLIEDIGDAKPEMKGIIGGLLDGVHLYFKDASEDREDVDAKVFAGMEGDTRASAEGTMKAAQNKIDEVKKFIDARKNTLSTSAQTEANAYLKAADAAVAEGKAKMAAQAHADAFALFKKAAREAQAAKLFVITVENLKIESKNHNETDMNTDREDRGHATKNEDDVIEQKNNNRDTHTNNETEFRGEAEIKIKADTLQRVKIETTGDANIHLGDPVGIGL
jgi:hypothetical protein